MKLVASMIVHNELGRYLPLAVDHLLSYCEEIRVLDDYSTDGTYEWLQKRRGVKVLRNPGPTFYEYESVARQSLLEWTLEAEPEYVLAIDADEFVSYPRAVRRCVDEGGPVYTLIMREVWHAGEQLQIRMDGFWGDRRCPILWKVPSELTPDWVIPDRKLACGREPDAVRRMRRIQPSGSLIFHFGWAKASERQGRFDRYMTHDQGQFHMDRHLQSILWPPERVLISSEEWPKGLEPVRQGIVDVAA